ncbi:MAG: hypothetical protein JO044_04615 [Mycobacteriaceae bacterium]|nr:hypothetical protein [Mycobacteriaceae bacterium]
MMPHIDAPAAIAQPPAVLADAGQTQSAAQKGDDSRRRTQSDVFEFEACHTHRDGEQSGTEQRQHRSALGFADLPGRLGFTHDVSLRGLSRSPTYTRLWSRCDISARHPSALAPGDDWAAAIEASGTPDQTHGIATELSAELVGVGGVDLGTDPHHHRSWHGV